MFVKKKILFVSEKLLFIRIKKHTQDVRFCGCFIPNDVQTSITKAKEIV